MQTTIKNLKVGELFTLKDYGEQDAPERAVWVRGEYDRGSNTFSCCKWENVNHETCMKGSRKVFSEIYF